MRNNIIIVISITIIIIAENIKISLDGLRVCMWWEAWDGGILVT